MQRAPLENLSWSLSVARPDCQYRAVFRFRDLQYEFRFRLLVRAELMAISTLDQDWLVEEFVLSRALIVPTVEQIGQGWWPAGLFSSLARRILQLSWSDPSQQQELVQRVSGWAETQEGRLELLAMVFLHVPIGKLWAMTLPEWAMTVHAATMAAAGAGISVPDWLERGELKPVEPEGVTETRNRPLAPGLVEEYGLQWRRSPSRKGGPPR